MTTIPRLVIAEEDYLIIWRETRSTAKSVVKRIAEIVHAYAAGNQASRTVPTKPLLEYVEIVDEVRS